MDNQIQYEGEGQEQSLLYSRFARSAQVPTMVRWVLRVGIAKDEHAAKYVLLCIAVLAVVVAIALQIMFSSSGKMPLPHPLYTPGGVGTIQ